MTVSGPVEEIATLRIELVGSDPPIWREVDIPTAITLQDLHGIVQAGMGWEDSHLWEFRIGSQSYGLPDEGHWGAEPRLLAARTALSQLLKPDRTVIGYVYDFGDSWEHRLILDRVRAGQPGIAYPRYVGGDRSAPPEDCGGIPGFYEMVAAIADPGHPGHDEAREAFADYDPEVIDEMQLALAVASIARRRKTAARAKANHITRS